MDAFTKESGYEFDKSSIKQPEMTEHSQAYLPTLNRFSSRNSLIECLGDNIVLLICTPPNGENVKKIEMLHRKIENSVKKLLSDPEPNKSWILLQLVELENHETTKQFYQKLKDLIASEMKIF